MPLPVDFGGRLVFEINMETEGMEEALALLQLTAQLGSSIKAVELSPRPRESWSDRDGNIHDQGDVTNYDVIEYLADMGYNFRFLDDAEADRVSRAFIAAFEKYWAKMQAGSLKKKGKGILRSAKLPSFKKAAKSISGASLGSVAGGTAGKLAGAIDRETKRQAQQVDAAAFRAAMLEYMKIVAEHIESGRTETGAARDLSPYYARWKRAEFGFVKPVGKATGQLLDNLNPGGTAARNIRLRRS